ncbi:response regulator transcription factor [Actimicrobium sp. CCI2.3]|uniref:response regulator transcription factor n=1 Tax=Actimicrobium sp. CCI2.3 TaxID=3048616 RepID=UPI002AB5D660|nr:response regulator transcription factor [Actimicrobium sp. CCI2.3]MDY7572752.1 response regulator transcription factor [Actimicrobium sp. CCI2.3]MEB0022272.1 response regulator transcription factor [Actimicrobium sp. CCI2.3]
MAHILLFEDNPSPPYANKGFIDEAMNDHDLVVVGSVASMWSTLQHQQADVLIVDLGLPDDYGQAIVTRMQASYPGVGVLVLTHGDQQEQRSNGLLLGADQILTKPVSASKLRAQVIALCRRIKRHRGAVVTSTPQQWRLRTTERQLQVNDLLAVNLTEKEFSFLRLLTHSSQPVARDTLNKEMHIDVSGDERRDTKKIDMLIYRLRRKVKSALRVDLPVRNAYGSGYSLTAPLKLA